MLISLIVCFHVCDLTLSTSIISNDFMGEILVVNYTNSNLTNKQTE